VSEDELSAVKQFLDELKLLGTLKQEDLTELNSYLKGEEQAPIPLELVADEADAPAGAAGLPAVAPELIKESDDSSNIRVQISNMSVPQKIKLAMFGNSTCRNLLVMDPNRVISMAVLRNPKLRAAELQEISRSTSISEHVLREIARNSNWTKDYKIKLNLVMNPKTPTDISIKWLKFLNATDLKRASKSKNISHVISNLARKLSTDG